jgi:hypothetical protein
MAEVVQIGQALPGGPLEIIDVVRVVGNVM